MNNVDPYFGEKIHCIKLVPNPMTLWLVTKSAWSS